MGACKSKASKPLHEMLETNKFQKSLTPSDFPMQFTLHLKTIKGIKLKVLDVYLEIDYFGFKKEITHPVYQKSNPSWEINRIIDIKIQSLEDFSRKFVIRIYSVKKKYLGNIKIGFTDIVAGPVSNSFVINSQALFIGRMEFDLKMNQKLNLSLNLKRAKVKFFEFTSNFNQESIEHIAFTITCDNDINLDIGHIPFDYYSKNFSKGAENVINPDIEDYVFLWSNSKNQSEIILREKEEIDEESETFLKSSKRKTIKPLLMLESQSIDEGDIKEDMSQSHLLMENPDFSKNWQMMVQSSPGTRKYSETPMDGFEMGTLSRIESGTSSFHLENSDKLDEVRAERLNSLHSPSKFHQMDPVPFLIKSFRSEDDKYDKEKVGSFHNSMTRFQKEETNISNRITNKNLNNAEPEKKKNQVGASGKSIVNFMENRYFSLNKGPKKIKELEFSLQTLANQLHATHLKFCVKDNKKTLALGCLSLDTFFLENQHLIVKKTNLDVSCEFDMWKLGNFVGVVQMNLTLMHPSFFKQNKAGIRTEDGIFYCDDILPHRQNAIARRGDNESIKLFKFYIDEFQQFRFNPDLSNNGQYKMSAEQKQLFSTFYDDVKTKIKHANFHYHDQNEIYNYQNSLIDLIKLIWTLLKEFDFQKKQKKLVYETLQIFLCREELTMKFLQYAPPKSEKVIKKDAKSENEENKNGTRDEPTTFKEMQVKIIKKYYSIIKKAINYFETKIQTEDLEDIEADFLAMLLVQFYIKIPFIRDSLIDVISSAIKTKTNVNFELGSNRGILSYLFPSDKRFQSFLSNDLELKLFYNDFIKEINVNSLVSQLVGSQVFITNIFIKKLLNGYYRDYVLKQNCNWNNLQGYKIFVQMVYIQILPQQSIREINEYLLDAIVAVVQNIYYFNVFFPLLITKTNLNDFTQIDKIFEVLARFYENSKAVLNKKVNVKLEFDLLVRLVSYILINEHLLSIEKCIFFLYKYMSYLHFENRVDFWRKFLFTPNFYKYFCHFSFSTRRAFHYFIIFNYYDRLSEFKIEKEYEFLIDKIENKSKQFSKTPKVYLMSRKQLIERKLSKNTRKTFLKVEEGQLEFPGKLGVYTERALNEYEHCFEVYKSWKIKKDQKGDYRTFDFPEIQMRVFNDKYEFSQNLKEL